MTVWWPKEESITMAIAKNREPSGSWNEIIYQHLIKPFDTYVEARNNEKKAICINTDDDTDALRSIFPDGNKRERKNNRQDDFLYASDFASKDVKRKKITTKKVAIEDESSSNNDSDENYDVHQLQVTSSKLKSLPKCPIKVSCSGDLLSTELQDPFTLPTESVSNSCAEDVTKNVSREHSNFCCVLIKRILKQLSLCKQQTKSLFICNAKNRKQTDKHLIISVLMLIKNYKQRKYIKTKKLTL